MGLALLFLSAGSANPQFPEVYQNVVFVIINTGLI